MTERKRILLEKDSNLLKEMLQSLTEDSSAALSEDEIQRALTKALASLHAGKTSPVSVSIITEVLRLSTPRNMLGPVDLSLYFEGILALLPHHHLNLAPLIKYRIPALLKDNTIIAAYFEAYSKIALNREHFDGILSIFVEENESCRHLIAGLLECDPAPKSLLSRVIRFVDLQLLSEEQYVKMFVACASCMTSADLRIVTGRNRIHFVRSAINIFKDEISRAYANDRDARIRSIIAASNPEPEIFSRLLHDPAEDVRVSLLESLDWERACTAKISDRIVDKSYKVREILFRIFCEGALRFHHLSIFDHRITKPGQLNVSVVSNGQSPVGGSALEAGNEELEMLKSFIYKLFEGCLTCYRDEFIKVLKSSGLSLDFLYDSRDMPGVAEYLHALDINTYTEIPQKYRGFYLEYIFRGELADAEIRDYLNSGTFEVLKHVRTPEMYYDLLLEKAKFCESADFTEAIVQKIKHILSTRHFININVSDSSDLTNTISANTLFINAHTICSNEFIEQQLNEEPTYPRLYFLVHQARTNELLRKMLLSAKLSDEQRIALLVYLNDPMYICDNACFLLEHSLSSRMCSKILNSKSITSSLIYFLATGRVTIKNSLFFLLCIRVAAHCTSPDGVKRIFIRYCNSVEQATFDVFYSICWELKNFVLSVQDETKEQNCFSLENIGNYPPECSAHKLRLKVKDRMLHFICDLIIGQRPATLCEIAVDLEKQGFIKLSDNDVEMIRHGQVIYE